MARLSLASLASLPGEVAVPGYDPRAVRVGVVHLGLGAFHRAHQAVCTQAALATDPRWGICAVSLRTAGACERLAEQDGLYSVTEKSPSGMRTAVIGAIRETLFAPAQRESVLARIADPAVRVVTLTVTEKGYCHDPATRRLDFSHPDIVHDLAHPGEPVSTLGVLVEGLARRAGRPVTVLCCDNLPDNGRTLAGLTGELAHARSGALAARIAALARFPNSMVDRIVPATTARDLDEVAARLGLRDEAAVVAEPFFQWVIEDDFAAERPAWELGGAQLVSEVAPFETMKLRLLNGSHSTIAYLGYLAGYEYVYQACADPGFVRLVGRLMAEEIAPTLVAPEGVDLAAYCAKLLERFRNPALPHRTWQIAMDGSQKLPQRLLNTARDRLRAGRPVELLALAVAGWMRYVTGVDEAGRPIDVRDPMAAQFKAVVEASGEAAPALVDGLLGLEAVFGSDLPRVPVFRDAVLRHLESLRAKGARATVSAT